MKRKKKQVGELANGKWEKKKVSKRSIHYCFDLAGIFFPIVVIVVVNIVTTKSDTQADYQEMNLVQQQKIIPGKNEYQ